MISTTVYISTLHEELRTDELDALLSKSRANNASNGISGMLTVRGRDVMQVLEGDADNVRDLYARISQDPRHRNVVTVWTSTHDARRYPDWSMGFDDLGTEPAAETAGSWPAPDVAAIPNHDSASGNTTDFVGRRAQVLRRALFSGNRLMTTLGIILDGHRPETILEPGGATTVRCSECRVFPGAIGDSYPCSTAKNAIWALEAVLPPTRD
jgi:hypothetical protein